MDWIAHFIKSQLDTSAAPLGFAQIALAVLLTYLGGVLSSLTPCVYPMIPITVSVVGGIPVGGNGKRSWKQVFLRASSYVFGMTLIYSFLGVAAGLTGRIFGSFTNTSGWYLFLGFI